MTDPLEGIGPQKPDDWRGLLVFDHLPPAIQDAEDATALNDYERQTWWREFDRPATPTERQLLEYLGYELPDELKTVVSHVGPVRSRYWPQLQMETQ